MNLNVIVKNEPLRETDGAEAQVVASEADCWYMQRQERKKQSTVLLHCDIWNYLWEILLMMLLPLTYRRRSPEKYSSHNVRDEENHDLALGYIADAYGVDPKAEKEAMALRKAWTCASRSHGTQGNGCRACDFLCTSPFLSL